MKKIMMALMITGAAYCSVNAQTTTKTNCVCKNDKTAMHKHTASKGVDKYDENYQICKGNRGYYVCNVRAPYTPLAYKNFKRQYDIPAAKADNWDALPYAANGNHNMQMDMNTNANNAMAVPQNQSYYSINTINAYEGYYPAAHTIKVSEDNNATAPYEGKPSPENDGPSKNNTRNLNVSNPNVNPVSGRID